MSFITIDGVDFRVLTGPINDIPVCPDRRTIYIATDYTPSISMGVSDGTVDGSMWLAITGTGFLHSVATTLAIANALTAANGKVNGAIMTITDGRKTGEGGGAGTGVTCAYWAAGPAGAGFYPVGLAAALVTA